MATKRISIRNALSELLKTQLNGGTYISNIYNNIETKQVFWDEIKDWPTVAVVNGRETTEYLPSSFKWKFLNIMIKVYVNEDDSGAQLEQLMVDIEDILDNHNSLEYETGKTTEVISLLSVETDEGLLYPFGVGELSIVIQYDNDVFQQ